MSPMTKLKNLQEGVRLDGYTTMKVGGPADYFVTVTSAEQMKEACDWATAQPVPVFVLGEGSNLVVGSSSILRYIRKVLSVEIYTMSG